MDKKDKLSILIVSDTHENIDNLNKLVKECEKNLYIPDYIFLLGDIVTINQGEQDNEIKNEKYYKIINESLQILEKISKNVIYIPGNHDPKTLFDNDNKIKFGNSSINLHKKKYDLNNNLLIIGIG
jgi:predicted phosphodiesterase